MSKSTKSAGKTAIAHTRAWVESCYPGSSVLEASKKVARFPGGRDASGEIIWINRTIEEDIFGVFDLAAFPLTRQRHPGAVRQGYGVMLIQTTTIGRDLSAIRLRQRKVSEWVRDTHGEVSPMWLGGVYVVGWVPRKHLRIWIWEWKQLDAHTFGGWREMAPDPARLPKRERKDVAKTARSLRAVPIPF